MSRHDPVLCFVRLPWAWFSFVPCDAPTLAGDRWDEPYQPDSYGTGNPAWPSQVIRVAFDPNGLLAPHQVDRLDKSFAEPEPSPVKINASRGGWLFTAAGTVVAHAGMPLSAFREAMRERGAEVYEPSWTGRPAFNPSDPAPGNVRLYPSYPWPRKAKDGVHVLLEAKGGPVDIGVAIAEGDENGPPLAICKIRVGDQGGPIALEAGAAAMLCVGLSRFMSLVDVDWDRCSLSMSKLLTVDMVTVRLDLTRDPAENARSLAAIWNEAAGYGPGEGARADGAAVIWPEATRHPAQMKAASEMPVHGPDDDEPSVGDVEDAVVMAQVPPC